MKKMKGKIGWVVSGSLLVLLSSILVAFPVLASEAERPIKLIANWFGPAEHMRIKNHHVPLFDEIERRTNGRVKFEHYYVDTLCKITNYAECMNKGIIDVCSLSFDSVAGKYPLLGASVPFVGKGDYQSIAEINRFIMKEVGTMYGFKPLACAFTPNYQLFLRREKEVRQLNDMRGLNIRGMGGSFGEGITAVGGNNVPIAVSEVAMSLQKGTVDGVLTYFGTARTYIDAISSVTMINYSSGLGTMAMPVKKWNALPVDIQNIILKVGREFDDRLIELCKTKELEVEKEFKARAIKFFELPAGDIARWKELSLPIRNKWPEGKGEKGRKIMEFIKMHS